MRWIALRPARSQDVDSIARLWVQASDWLRERGLDQWQYAPKMDRLGADVNSGSVYVVTSDSYGDDLGIFATITLDESADPEFWFSEDDPESALYVHRSIVRPDMRGYRIGSALLDWASERAEHSGKRWLRLDAWRTNSALHEYYLREGFSLVRTVDLPHRRSGACFQRSAHQKAFRGGPHVNDVIRPKYDLNGNPIFQGAENATGP